MTWVKFWQDLAIVTVVAFAIYLVWLADTYAFT